MSRNGEVKRGRKAKRGPLPSLVKESGADKNTTDEKMIKRSELLAPGYGE